MPGLITAKAISSLSLTLMTHGRIREFGQYDHLRVFGNDSKAMLQSFGFEVSQIDGSAFDSRIKPVIDPADYDSNILWILSLTKRIFS